MVDALSAAIAQFHGTNNWQENLDRCLSYMSEAVKQDIDLLVLPEAVMQTTDGDTTDTRRYSQPLDGAFVTSLLEASQSNNMCTVVGITEDTGTDRPSNTVLAIRNGRIISIYRKLHLYDAFSAQESNRIAPGNDAFTTFDVNGFAVGMMTCYDVRFPESARLLAEQGADIIALPAAWISGPLKEMHWDVMCTARALENTCYVVAAGKTGPGRIGLSSVIDPEGLKTTQLGSGEGMTSTKITRSSIDVVRTRLPLLQQRRFRIDPSPMPPPIIN